MINFNLLRFGALDANCNCEMDATPAGPSRSIVRFRVGTALVVVAAIGWLMSGHAVAGALAAAAILAGFGALIDASTARIPNQIPLAVLAVAVVSIPLVSLFDDRQFGSVTLAAFTGIAYSGAPLLFAIWLVRPSAIGGGDWKLVAALGSILGLALPFSALVMTAVACLVQIGWSLIRRTQVQPFAPSLAVGYASTLLLLPVLTSISGGPYA